MLFYTRDKKGICLFFRAVSLETLEIFLKLSEKRANESKCISIGTYLNKCSSSTSQLSSPGYEYYLCNTQTLHLPPTALIPPPTPFPLATSGIGCGSAKRGSMARFRLTHSSVRASILFRVDGGNSLAPQPTALRIVKDNHSLDIPSSIPW